MDNTNFGPINDDDDSNDDDDEDDDLSNTLLIKDVGLNVLCVHKVTQTTSVAIKCVFQINSLSVQSNLCFSVPRPHHTHRPEDGVREREERDINSSCY